MPGDAQRTLVLGGARSGKSAFAESLFGDAAVRYIATGRRSDGDTEWDQRIDRHRAVRPGTWSTVEVTRADNLVTALAERMPTIVDDMGTWLTGALDDRSAWDGIGSGIDDLTDDLCRAVRTFDSALVLVTPEVGLGVIPDTRAGRVFRDHIGVLNARLADACDSVILVIAGRALRLE